MIKKHLNRIMTLGIISASLLALNPIGANAEWRQGNYGQWWYTEGSSYATGWRQIDGKWYYFNSDGYTSPGVKYINKSWYYFDNNCVMQTGWIKESDNWYYYYSTGEAAENTVIDGYTTGGMGGWDKNPEFTYEQALKIAENKYGTNEDISFSGSNTPKYENGEKYYLIHLASKSAQEAGGSGTLGNYKVFADGRIEE